MPNRFLIYLSIILIPIMAAVTTWALLKTYDTAQAIQEERAASVRRACLDQNARHDDTITALYTLAPASRGRDATITLINALVPRRDCDALVTLTVRER